MPDEWDQDTNTVGVEAEELASAVDEKKKRPCVTVLTGTTTGQMFKLEADSVTIGRAPDAEIRIVDDGISRHHARLRFVADRLWLDDLQSHNGTFVNGQRLDGSVELEDGDKIQVGATTVLRFAYHDVIDESFHENLLSSALRDPLTRLFNKRYFLDRLDGELKFARRHATSLSLLLIDIDHFKQVNDTHGHLAGDAVLVSLANALVKAVRNEDVVARFGGEELAIILRAIPLEPALLLADRLRELIQRTVTVHAATELRVTASFGAAEFPTSKADTIEALIESADKALYRAKGAGRNRVSRITVR